MQNRRKELVFWRIENRMRQREICELLGITPAHYSNLERGLSDPSFDLLIKFRDTFKINNVLELFEKENSKWRQ